MKAGTVCCPSYELKYLRRAPNSEQIIDSVYAAVFRQVYELHFCAILGEVARKTVTRSLDARNRRVSSSAMRYMIWL